MLALSETKLKGRGEFKWEKVRGIKGGVRGNQWAKEGVAILMSERMWNLMVEYKVVSSRIVWMKIKIGGCKLVIVSTYGPGSEHSEDVRADFWESLNDCGAT